MKTKLQYCYHTHTKRCGHATGNDEEYVKSAIKLGIKRLGFSDHIILPKGFEQPTVRGSYYLLDDYISSVTLLKEKYKNDVEIHIGFEAEYYPVMLDYYRKLLKDKVEYLILGQHCYLDENNHFQFYFSRRIEECKIQKYTNDIIAGLKTGLFKYLCHPDLFMRSYAEWTPELEKCSRQILKTCEELDIPIELNLCGMRRDDWNENSRAYPTGHFFDLVKEYRVRVVLGVDAHEPKNFNEEEIKNGLEFAKRHGFELEMDYYI